MCLCDHRRSVYWPLGRAVYSLKQSCRIHPTVSSSGCCSVFELVDCARSTHWQIAGVFMSRVFSRFDEIWFGGRTEGLNGAERRGIHFNHDTSCCCLPVRAIRLFRWDYGQMMTKHKLPQVKYHCAHHRIAMMAPWSAYAWPIVFHVYYIRDIRSATTQSAELLDRATGKYRPANNMFGHLFRITCALPE